MTSTIHDSYINNREESIILIYFCFLLEIFDVITAIAKAISNKFIQLIQSTEFV